MVGMRSTLSSSSAKLLNDFLEFDIWNQQVVHTLKTLGKGSVVLAASHKIRYAQVQASKLTKLLWYINGLTQ